LARLLVVYFSPQAEGSGVQRVEAFYSGDIEPATIAILPVKFFGGIVAIGCGLALGREGWRLSNIIDWKGSASN